MTQTVRVEGLAELRDALNNQLVPRLRKVALQTALTKGAAVIVRQAKTLVPVKSGTLRRAIAQMKSRASTDVRPSRIIRVRQGKKQQAKNRDGFYWRFIEFGRAEVRADKVLGTPKKGFFGKTVKAVPAHPFLRPAFESKKMEALNAIVQSLGPEIQKTAERAAARSRSRLRRGVLGL